MKKSTAQDIRTQRTRGAIKTAFSELLAESDYAHITIKSLAEQAGINRKTFYLHYDSLDALLAELQQEIINSVLTVLQNSASADFRVTLRALYRVMGEQPALHQKLLCSGSYQLMYQQITQKLLWLRHKDAPALPKNAEQVKSMLTIQYVAVSSLELYRAWVTMGGPLPWEAFVEYAAALICDGVEGKNKLEPI